jgi:hypothetical protein
MPFQITAVCVQSEMVLPDYYVVLALEEVVILDYHDLEHLGIE